jgi:hypothetical protein
MSEAETPGEGTTEAETETEAEQTAATTTATEGELTETDTPGMSGADRDTTATEEADTAGEDEPHDNLMAFSSSDDNDAAAPDVLLVAPPEPRPQPAPTGPAPARTSPPRHTPPVAARYPHGILTPPSSVATSSEYDTDDTRHAAGSGQHLRPRSWRRRRRHVEDVKTQLPARPYTQTIDEVLPRLGQRTLRQLQPPKAPPVRARLQQPASRSLRGSKVEYLWRRGLVHLLSPVAAPPPTTPPHTPPGPPQPAPSVRASAVTYVYSPERGRFVAMVTADAPSPAGAAAAPRHSLGFPTTGDLLSAPSTGDLRRASRGSLPAPELPDLDDSWDGGGGFGGGGGGSSGSSEGTPPPPLPSRPTEIPRSPGERRFRASYWQCVCAAAARGGSRDVAFAATVAEAAGAAVATRQLAARALGSLLTLCAEGRVRLAQADPLHYTTIAVRVVLAE